MSFGTAHVLGAAAPRFGFSGGVSADAVHAFDGVLYDVLRTALDLARLVSPSRTVQASHLATVAKIAAILRPPSQPERSGRFAGRKQRQRQSGGNATGLPSEYFGVDSGAYGGVGSGSNGAPDPALAHPGLTSTFVPSLLGGCGAVTCKGKGGCKGKGKGKGAQAGGNTTGMPTEYYGTDSGAYASGLARGGTVTSFDPSGLARAGLDPVTATGQPLMAGGAGPRVSLTDDVLARLVHEYGARRGGVRVSAAARRAVKALVEASATRVLATAASRRPTRSKLTAAAIGRATRALPAPLLVLGPRGV
jgi:hypothetical protein